MACNFNRPITYRVPVPDVAPEENHPKYADLSAAERKQVDACLVEAKSVLKGGA